MTAGPASALAPKQEDPVLAATRAAVVGLLEQDTAAAKHLAQLAADPLAAVRALALLARYTTAALEAAALRSGRTPAREWADVARAVSSAPALTGIAQYELRAILAAKGHQA